MTYKAYATRFIFCAIAVIVGGCASTPSYTAKIISPVTPPSVPRLIQVRTVVVDAGHGGKDPGAVHYGMREKDINLDIARRLKRVMEGRGFRVFLTRDRDEFIGLSRRCVLAGNAKADAFISVHANANNNRKVSGVEVYYPRDSVINSSISFPPSIQPNEVAIPTTAIKKILWDLVLTRARWQAARMASIICSSMKTRLSVPCRRVNAARFVVLRECSMPSVLVEVGYLSNRSEASRLSSPSYREQIAEAIAMGFISSLQYSGS